MNDTNDRHLTIDDMVGILVYRANQMSAYLSAHGVASDFNLAMQHLVSMYADVELAQRMIDEIAGRVPGEPAQQTN